MKGEVIKVWSYGDGGKERYKAFVRDNETNNVFKCLVDYDAPTVPMLGEFWETVGSYKGMPVLGLKSDDQQPSQHILLLCSEQNWKMIKKGSLVCFDNNVMVTKLDINHAFFIAEHRMKNVGKEVREFRGDKPGYRYFPVYTVDFCDPRVPF